MNEPNESLEDKVQRLEAELAEVKAERDEYKEQFQAVAHDLSRKEWEGFTQEEFEELVRHPVSLRSVLEQWRGDQRDV